MLVTHRRPKHMTSNTNIVISVVKSALDGGYCRILCSTICAQSHGNNVNTSNTVNDVVFFYYFGVVVCWSTFESHDSAGDPIYTARYCNAGFNLS